MSWQELLRLLLAGLCWLLPAGFLSGPPTSHGSSRWASGWEAKLLGRIAAPERMWPDGLCLGWLGGRLLQTPAEDNLLLLGVQRSGKTSSVVVPTLLGWADAVVATSTKEELVRLTGAERRRRGPTFVFAPLDADTGWISDLGLTEVSWNPLSDLRGAAEAAEMAHLFAAYESSGASHWSLSAASLLTGLFLYEQLQGRDLRAVLAQLGTTGREHYSGLVFGIADRTVVETFTAYSQTPDREAGSIASTARACLSLWLDDRVSTATAADGPSPLHLGRLLEEGGTLYLVAPAEDAERCRPLFSTLLATLLRRATAKARQQGGVLAPRLLLALDEAANFARLPRLSGYVSTGPGQGIQLLLCFHDLAQLEAGYGKEAARTVWNNCRARLLLPGQGDLETLETFSRSIGEETHLFSTGSRSASKERIARPLAAVDELRRSKQAVLLYGTAPPARLQLRRWDQVPAWAQLVNPPPPAL